MICTQKRDCLLILSEGLKMLLYLSANNTDNNVISNLTSLLSLLSFFNIEQILLFNIWPRVSNEVLEYFSVAIIQLSTSEKRFLFSSYL